MLYNCAKIVFVCGRGRGGQKERKKYTFLSLFHKVDTGALCTEGGWGCMVLSGARDRKGGFFSVLAGILRENALNRMPAGHPRLVPWRRAMYFAPPSTATRGRYHLAGATSRG